MNAHIQSQISLKPYNTFGMDVTARWWLDIHDESGALVFIADNRHSNVPVLVMGGGSNILFTKDFEGIILKNQIKGREIVRQDASSVWLRLGGGENWHETVLYTIAQGWGGMENLSLIPGSVGAAPIQNIGAYGVELRDMFDSLEALHLETGATHVFSHAACQFGYRDSIFKREARDKYLITRVTLRLSRHPVLHTSYGDIQQELAQLGGTPDVRLVSEAVCRIRTRKLPDPAITGNAGSFFKNPTLSAAQFATLKVTWPDIPSYPQPDGGVKVPAAWLIQTSGWKGFRNGNYGVHTQQALVLVNYGGASGRDIFQLSEDIRQDVARKFGIDLEREVNIL